VGRGEIEICHARGHGDALSARTKNILKKYFSLNVCVSNVFVVIQSCDSCRIHGHLLHDRAPIARDATQNIFSHERSA